MLKALLTFMLTVLLLFNDKPGFAQKGIDTSNLVGTWEYTFGWFGHTLVLKEDHTYKYRVAGDMIDMNTEGVWKVEKNKLVLDSYKKKDDESMVIPKLVDSISGIRFFVRDTEGDPMSARIKMITDSLLIDTLFFNLEGVFDFPGFKVVTAIEVSSVSYRKVVWSNTSGYNYFEVVMASEQQFNIFQTNEKWKIKDNRLYYPYYREDNRLLKNRKRVNYFVKSPKL